MDGFFFFSVFLLYYYYYTICIMISCFCIYYCLYFSDIYMLQGRVWVLCGWRCCFLTYSITYTQQLNYENRSNQVVWNKECENIYCSLFYSFKKQLYLNLLAFSCLLLTLKGSHFFNTYYICFCTLTYNYTCTLTQPGTHQSVSIYNLSECILYFLFSILRWF